MAKRIIVIGGVAAGMSAASQAKRRDPALEVIAFERGPFVSYAACGMPYNLLAPEVPITDLVAITPERFRDERQISVRTGHRVTAIDAKAGRVFIEAGDGGGATAEAYDRLVIATGASAIRPPWPGIDLPGVFVLRELTDGAALKAYLKSRQPRTAVITGAGYIGLEVAEALTELGLQVTVLEKAGQPVPGFEKVIADQVAAELKKHGVALHTGVSVQGFAAAAGKIETQTSAGNFAADLVIVAIGVRPNVELARAAGNALGATGAIATDAGMRTNLEGIFAAGDCAEAWHRVLGRPAYIPLGTTANKQGKVAGANAAGADERFGGIVGTAAFKVFDIEVARTGGGALELAQAGREAVAAPSKHIHHAHSYPGARPVHTVVLAEKGTGRLLGAQMAGPAAAKRIDVFAAALHGTMTVADIEDFDLSYAPPFAPVYDPVLIAAGVARKAALPS